MERAPWQALTASSNPYGPPATDAKVSPHSFQNVNVRLKSGAPGSLASLSSFTTTFLSGSLSSLAAAAGVLANLESFEVEDAVRRCATPPARVSGSCESETPTNNHSSPCS